MITVGDIRKAIEGLPDDDVVSNDIVEGPDEWTANIVGVTRGIPEHWKGVGNVDEVPKGLWVHIEIVPMAEVDDDEDYEGLQEDVDAHC